MVRVDVLTKMRAYFTLYCPECNNKLYPLGLSMNPFWCNKCKVSYWLELRKAKYTEKECKDVLGFPEELAVMREERKEK